MLCEALLQCDSSLNHGRRCFREVRAVTRLRQRSARAHSAQRSASRGRSWVFAYSAKRAWRGAGSRRKRQQTLSVPIVLDDIAEIVRDPATLIEHDLVVRADHDVAHLRDIVQALQSKPEGSCARNWERMDSFEPQ